MGPSTHYDPTPRHPTHDPPPSHSLITVCHTSYLSEPNQSAMRHILTSTNLPKQATLNASPLSLFPTSPPPPALFAHHKRASHDMPCTSHSHLPPYVILAGPSLTHHLLSSDLHISNNQLDPSSSTLHLARSANRAQFTQSEPHLLPSPLATHHSSSSGCFYSSRPPHPTCFLH